MFSLQTCAHALGREHGQAMLAGLQGPTTDAVHLRAGGQRLGLEQQAEQPLGVGVGWLRIQHVLRMWAKKPRSRLENAMTARLLAEITADLRATASTVS